MDLKLSVYCEVEGEPRSYELEFQKDLVTIGRHSMNDVQIPDRNVSAEHARLLVEDDRVFLLDLGSNHGTLVDGKAAGSHVKTPIEDGAELTLASYRVVVAKSAQELDETTMEKTSMVAMRMVKEVLGSFSSMDEPPFFEVENDGEKGARFELTEDDREYKIGREKDCDLILKHWSISRKHALIRRAMNELTVMDLGSKNGVRLNGDKVEEPRHLKDGDVVAIGHTELRLHNPAASLLDSLDDTPTPITNLSDLGVDLSSRREELAAAPAREPAPSSPPQPVATPRSETPYSGESATRTAAGRPSQESSFADYLPLIAGGLLVVGAIVAALFLFILK